LLDRELVVWPSASELKTIAVNTVKLRDLQKYTFIKDRRIPLN
jgi:hypothetical protein